jgi:hypothetical protein
MSTSARTTARTSSRSIRGWSRACISSPGTALGRWPRCSVCSPRSSPSLSTKLAGARLATEREWQQGRSSPSAGLAGYASVPSLVLDTLFISLVLLAVPARPGAVLEALHEPGRGPGRRVLTRPAIPPSSPSPWPATTGRGSGSGRRALRLSQIALGHCEPLGRSQLRGTGTFVPTRTTTGWRVLVREPSGRNGRGHGRLGRRPLRRSPCLELRQRLLSTDGDRLEPDLPRRPNTCVRDPAARRARDDEALLTWWVAPTRAGGIPWWQFAFYHGFYIVTLGPCGPRSVFVRRHRTAGQLDGVVLCSRPSSDLGRPVAVLR